MSKNVVEKKYKGMENMNTMISKPKGKKTLIMSMVKKIV